MAAEHSAAVHGHDLLHQTTYDRFVLRVFWWQQLEFRPQQQDESLSQLKSCCHEDREHSTRHLFCFQCCSSPVHWQIFQSQLTKKGSASLSKTTTNFTSRVSGPIVYIVYVAHAAHGALSHDMHFCTAAGARAPSTVVLRILRFFSTAMASFMSCLPTMYTLESDIPYRKYQKIHEKLAFRFFELEAKSAWQGGGVQLS